MWWFCLAGMACVEKRPLVMEVLPLPVTEMVLEKLSLPDMVLIIIIRHHRQAKTHKSQQFCGVGGPLEQLGTLHHLGLGLEATRPDWQGAAAGPLLAPFEGLEDVLHLFCFTNFTVVQQLGEVVLQLSHPVHDPGSVLVGPVPEPDGLGGGKLRQLTLLIHFFHLLVEFSERAVAEVKFVGQGEGGVKDRGLVDDVAVFLVVVGEGDGIALPIVKHIVGGGQAHNVYQVATQTHPPGSSKIMMVSRNQQGLVTCCCDIQSINSTGMDGGNPFEKKYKQLNLLGKGNYGKVYKVKLNDGSEGKDAKYFCAKKMFLEGLTEQEIKSAFGEIEILEKLNREISSSEIPFVVAYKEFFRIENELIIIMEYCECGDLSTFVKNLKKNGQRLNEKIIAYWFIQLLFGVRALHSKNILHRDLKSANIFLTKDYSLKIGDFGISKVLERSSAITCIGTPLYLSPEVCNNQPYSYSSDMWAMGCILYEMCTQKYPFEASNMIVLAKKIVMDDVAPLPEYYSPELNNIVMKMFTKDSKQRLSAKDFFQEKYIMEHVKNFIQDQGKLEQLATPISTNSVVEKSEVTEEEEDTMKTINSVVERTKGQEDTLNYSKSLTPREKMLLRKEEETQRKIMEATKATKDSFAVKAYVKDQKLKNLSSTTQASFGQNSTKKQLQAKMQHDNKARSEVKYKAKEMEKMQTINLADIAKTLNNVSVAEDDYEDVPLPGHSEHIPIGHKTAQMGRKQEAREEIQEDIAEEEIEEELEEYYDEEFEDYVEEDENVRAIEQTKKKENILAYFENAIDEKTLSPAKRDKINAAFKPLGQSDVKMKVGARERDCEALVGRARYQQLSALFRAGKIDFVRDYKKLNANEKKVLYMIEEIMLFQDSR